MCKAVNGENYAKHGLVQGKFTFSKAGNVTVHFPYKNCVALIQDKFIRNVEL